MELLDPWRHGTLLSLDLAFAREEDTLDAQLDELVGLVNGGTDNKEAVGRAGASRARSIAGAHRDRSGCLFEDLEVVGDLCALLVVACLELFGVPKLRGGLRAAVLVLEVLALDCVAWEKMC